MSRIVCLTAQLMLSINSLNCAGGRLSNAIFENEVRRQGGMVVKLLTREAVEIDDPKQFEEAGTMFWELGKVLIDHVQCWLEHCIEDSRHLRGEKRL